MTNFWLLFSGVKHNFRQIPDKIPPSLPKTQRPRIYSYLEDHFLKWRTKVFTQSGTAVEIATLSGHDMGPDISFLMP